MLHLRSILYRRIRLFGYFILVILSISLLSGCELPGGPALVPTLSQMQVYATAGITPYKTPTSVSVQPSATPIPSIELRSGYTRLFQIPDPGFPIRESIHRGEEFEITGRNQKSDWFQVQTNRDRKAWLPVDSLVLTGQVDLARYEVIDPIPPVPAPVLDWKGGELGRLCLDEQSSFNGSFADENPQEKPVEAFNAQVRAILESVGIQTNQNLGDCDATLQVQITITPRGKLFPEAITGKRRMCYSGVEISSTWELTKADRKKSFPLNTRRGTVDHPIYCASQTHYQQELTEITYTGLHKLWGGAVLPGMLQVDDPIVNELGIQLAAAGGRHSQAVIPDLITYIDNPDLGIQAYRALKTITGKGFNKQTYLWQSWWDEQSVADELP